MGAWGIGKRGNFAFCCSDTFQDGADFAQFPAEDIQQHTGFPEINPFQNNTFYFDSSHFSGLDIPIETKSLMPCSIVMSSFSTSFSGTMI